MPSDDTPPLLPPTPLTSTEVYQVRNEVRRLVQVLSDLTFTLDADARVRTERDAKIMNALLTYVEEVRHLTRRAFPQLSLVEAPLTNDPAYMQPHIPEDDSGREMRVMPDGSKLEVVIDKPPIFVSIIRAIEKTSMSTKILVGAIVTLIVLGKLFGLKLIMPD